MTVRPDTVFYDGDCGLCHGFVRFLLARDRDGSRFRFAPLAGPTFRSAVPEAERPRLPDSVVLRTPDDVLLVRSAAIVHALRRLPAPWPLVGGAAALVPRPVRDWAYDRVAAVRKRVAAKPAAACPIVPPDLRSRFLD